MVAMLANPLVLAVLILIVLAVLLFVAAWSAFGRRRRQASAAAQAAPTVPTALTAPAAPAAPAAPVAPAVPTARAAPPPTVAPTVAPAGAPVVAPTVAPARGVAYLTLGNAARFYPLHDPVSVIGREPGCQVEVPAEFGGVSRRHAQIEHSGGDYILSDLDSANGVWMNEALVRRNLLRDGAVFSLGRQVACTFHRNA